MKKVKEFSEVCSDVTKTARKILQSDYLLKGKYAIFDQGKDYIGGYFSEEEGLAKNYPYILFGDHTRVIKYVNQSCFLGADGVKLIKVIDNDFDVKYVYYSLIAKPIINCGYSRHYKYLKEKQFIVRSKEEQNKIVAILDKIENLISKRKKQLEYLDTLIKARFNEMFGDPMLNTKQYTLKTFGEIFKIQAGGTPSKSKKEYWDNGDISWIGSNLCQNCILYENDGKYITELGFNNSSVRLFDVDTVLIALVGATIGKASLLKYKTTTNQNVLGIQNIKESNNNPYFVFYYTQGLYGKFLQIGDGGFSMASKGFVSKLPFPEVDIILQNQFADFVTKVEDIKAKVKASLEQLEALKREQMQKYFG